MKIGNFRRHAVWTDAAPTEGYLARPGAAARVMMAWLIVGLCVGCAGPSGAHLRRTDAGAAADLAGLPARTLAAGLSNAAAAADVAGPVPHGPLAGDVAPLAYTWALAIDANADTFSGSVIITVMVDRPTSAFYLHGQDLQVEPGFATDAHHGRHRLSYSQVSADGVAQATVDPPLPAGRASLHLRYRALWGSGLSGIYRVHQGGASYVYSQFEPLAARRALPCFDEPRFKVPMLLQLTARSANTPVSNTAPVAAQSAGDGMTTWTFAPTAPLPTYLWAVMVGPFDVASADIAPSGARRRTLPLRGVAPAGQAAGLQGALRRTPELLAALENYFRMPYPFDKLDLIAVPDFGSSAMENAGAITFRDWLLLQDPVCPDRVQQRTATSVLAHELSHQWFGNAVTMAWWDDLWLNESFATWMGQKTAQAVDPASHHADEVIVGMHLAMRQDALASARRIRQPCPVANDVHSAFDGITYLKGGAILNMFEHALGPETFARGVRDYVGAHPFGTATSGELLVALASAAGDANLPVAMQTFLQQAHVPWVDVQRVCGQGAGEPSFLQLTQKPYRSLGQQPLGEHGAPQPIWHIPVCTRVGPTGRHRAPKSRCTMLTTASATIPLPEGCPSWSMPNVGGVGYYQWQLPEADVRDLVDQDVGLSPGEALSVAHNAQRNFDAGTCSAATVLHVMEKLAARPEYFVATSGLPLWREVMGELVRPADRSATAAYLGALLRPRAQALCQPGAALDAQAAAWREELLAFLALELDDAWARAYLAPLGVRYADNTAPLHDNPELAGVAMAVAAEAHGPAFVARLLTMLGETQTSASARRQVVIALSLVRTPEVAEQLRAQLLQPAPLRQNEVRQILQQQMAQPQLREATWAFMRQHFAALQARTSEVDVERLVGLTGYLCRAEAAAEVAHFFAGSIDALPGGPRALATAQEAIGLCVARRAAQAPGMRRAMAAAVRRRPL